MTDQPTTSVKLKKIYETISDKTLSFGCKTNKWIVLRVDKYFITEWNWENTMWYDAEHYTNTIIWHLVMIWDVLDWIQQNNTEPHQKFWWYTVGDINLNLRHSRQDKRKPIDDQSEECIDFIYSLIEWTKKD